MVYLQGMREDAPPIIIQEVSVPGCVACVQFEKIWPEIQTAFPGVKLVKIDATTAEGQQLVVQHGIFAAPGLIINGGLFSTGGVNKDSLIKKLHEVIEK